MGNTFGDPGGPGKKSVHPHACGEHVVKIFLGRLKYGSSPRLWGTHTRKRVSRRRWRFIPTPVGNTDRSGAAADAGPVHPHACGEHKEAQKEAYKQTGSSPRLWGTLSSRMLTAMRLRFIPTPVGNTPRRASTSPRKPVHPHACGEHRQPKGGGKTGAGSSPRLWGTRIVEFRNRRLARFIPTPVGNTLPRLKRHALPPVHPHACGEHGPKRSSINNRNGSSPRLWGTPHGING